MSGSLRIALGTALCLLAGTSGTLAAQSASHDAAAPLEFHGFRAGAHLADIAAQVQRLDGTSLKCLRARLDRRISECRATLTDPEFGGPVEVWLSAVDSVASVVTLSGEVAPDQLDQWRSGLESRYGRVGARVQGSQWAMQWVRRNRMIRLTWRINHASKVASVALVDGAVLDAWGRERARRAASRS
jgi:hypothetical protein